MKRQPSRVPSPTPTAYSGISNYRNDSYRPAKDAKNAPAVPTIDYRQVSKTHFAELSSYLAAYLARAAPNSRSTARSKLTRLTIQQFHELSTDVYDELVRRKNENQVPFLPVKEEFHPKRNQARQKLATLPTSRFEDLSSDVYYELARRYPEFKEDPNGRASPTYDDYPAPGFPTTSPQQIPRSTSLSRGSDRGDREVGLSYSASVSSSRRRPSESEFSSGRRSEEGFRRPDDSYARPMVGDESFSAALASRRKASQDTTRRSEERERGEFVRRPSAAASVASLSESGTSAAPTQSTTATSAVIIPNKSTIEEEYIDIPYGREGRDSAIASADERGRDIDQEPDTPQEFGSPMASRSPTGGLSGLTARLKMEDEEDGVTGNRSGDDLYNSYGRSSVDSSRSIGAASRFMGSRSNTTDEQDRMRREYEFKIATMQSQITNLQRDLTDANDATSKRGQAENKVRQLEDELALLRQRAEEQGAAMRSMQRELEDLKESRQREALQAEEDREELQIYRDRVNKLEDERELRGDGDPEVLEQLRFDMEGLLTEINELSRRNDDLMIAKDSDALLIRELDAQLKEYKRKYEVAKTELRSVKATSQLYVQPPKFDRGEDQLPVAPDGGILDIHVTAFLSAIDSLLAAGRSNAPTRVLTPMKAIVNAVTNIVDDVKLFEQRPPRDRSDIDMDALRALRERAEATLGNLVTATKTHATSSGLSPVSLLDAAASHVSVTITEIGRTVFIRKATKSEQDQFAHPATTAGTGTSPLGYSPSLRSVDESRSIHQRKASQASISSRLGRFAESITSSPGQSRNATRRPPSENSSSEQTNSPPPIFDTQNISGGVVSDDSAQADGPEDAWAEVKPYLEAQTEAIVCAIQAVLSGVRSPTPSPTLNENLTQIITIVSSIVAVCNENLPPASAQLGSDILRELSDHANKLSEVQALPEVTKESRQIMAKSSFAVANAMKGLMKL